MNQLFNSYKEFIDLYIVGGLILIIIITFIVSRIGILPKKTLPYIAAAVAGAIGLSIFNNWRVSKLMKEYNKAKEEAEKVKQQLAEMEKKYILSQQKRDEIIAEEEKKIAAHQKQILLIEEQERKRKEEIENLSGSDLEAEFDSFLARVGK